MFASATVRSASLMANLNRDAARCPPTAPKAFWDRASRSRSRSVRAPAAGIERYDPFSPGRARVIGDVGGGPDGGGGAWRPTAVDEPAPDAFSKTVKSLGAMSLDDLEAAADSVRPPD